MATEHSEENCVQCDEPLGDEEHHVVIGTCASCGMVHPLAFVHALICAVDFQTNQSLTNTRRRRAGAKGLN